MAIDRDRTASVPTASVPTVGDPGGFVERRGIIGLLTDKAGYRRRQRDGCRTRAAEDSLPGSWRWRLHDEPGR